MSKPKVTTDTVKVSRLGCMRTSTVVSSDSYSSVEHVEVWVPTDKDSETPDSDAKQAGKSKE